MAQIYITSNKPSENKKRKKKKVKRNMLIVINTVAHIIAILRIPCTMYRSQKRNRILCIIITEGI